jgi:hypothetical protein
MQPKKGEISPFSISKNSSNFVVAIEAYPQPLPKRRGVWSGTKVLPFRGGFRRGYYD